MDKLLDLDGLLQCFKLIYSTLLNYEKSDKKKIDVPLMLVLNTKEVDNFVSSH